ncbi:MAG: FAD-dependent oxidoreductase [Bermanella sp.]
MNKTCIVVGASHAGAQVALSVRQQGWLGEIIIVSDEAGLPYQRPPLSKTFLSGEKSSEQILIRQQDVYEKANVQFRFNSTVQDIDRANKTVTLQDGESIQYDKLALCTGAGAINIPLPGINKTGMDKQGVFYLRNQQDALNIREHITQVKNVVIIGGGFIGLECAAILNQQGLQVTVLEAQERLLQRVVSPEVSQFYQNLHTTQGVSIVTNALAAAIEGDGQQVSAVTCKDSKQYPAQMVIIGVGVRPNVELAKNCGLEIDNGICVNEYAETSDPDIVAAGDCTAFYHDLYRRSIRLESIQNAMEQAKAAAASICGKQVPHKDFVPRFWSDQYHLKLQMIGLPEGYDQVEIRGDMTSQERFCVFYLKADKLISVSTVNMPKVLMKAQGFIKTQERVSIEDIDLMVG